MSEYDVFLSHNSADKPAVEELARRLVKAGVQPWLDRWNLIPGEPWQEAIEEALALCATCAVFVGPSGTGPWQNEEMRAAIDRRVRESQGCFRVIPVLLPRAERGERGRLPAFLVATTWVEFRRSLDDEDAFHRLVCGIRGVEPGPGPGQAIYEGECPYRGLQFFDVEHAPFFFGREALTEWLLEELRGDNRFLAIIGPSGSGKSSLARAGLVAALKRGEIEGSDQWPVIICRPGPDPLESLAVALSQDTSEALALMTKLADHERALHITARVALRDAPPKRRLVVLVDQFEEVFTLCHDEGLRQALICNLLYASNVAEGQTMVLLAMRADFYGKCAAYHALAAALADHQLLVGPMTEDKLQRAIERPAQLAGCEFEPGLVDTLLRDVFDQPGGLPLLQHALLELWGQRDGQRLTHAAYRAIGGVEGALERRAEAVYGQLSGPEQEICRRVFMRLTQPGEGTEDTKRRASLQELLPVEGRQETIQAVVQRLASPEARLVTTEGGAAPGEECFVEVAHEALIRGWSRLREWIERDREALRVHRRLTEAAREWEENEGDESFLYRGARLAEAEEWTGAHVADLNPLERDFLRASTQAREARRIAARRRMQRIIAGLVVGLVIISGLAIFAWGRSQLAEQRRFAAESAKATAQAESTRAINAESMAIAEATRALNAEAAADAQRVEAEEARTDAEAKRLEAEQARADAEAQRLEAERQRRLALSRQLAAKALYHLDTQPDLALLLAVEAYHRMITPSLEVDSALRSAIAFQDYTEYILYDHEDRVTYVTWSPDGTRLLTASLDKTARIWNADTYQSVVTLNAEALEDDPHKGALEYAMWNADGTRVLTAGWGDGADLWDAQTGNPLGSFKHKDVVKQAMWNRNESLILTVGWDGEAKEGDAKVWDPQTQKELFTLGEPNARVNHAAWSPDGTRIVTASEDGTAQVWSWSQQAARKLVPFTDHTGPINYAVWSPDGARIVTASDDSTARIWDAKTGRELVKLTGHTGPVVQAVWNTEDGTRVATASDDGTARVWDAQSGAILAVLAGHTRRVNQVAWSPDDTRVVTASDDGTARVWDAESSEMLAVLAGHTGVLRHVAWSPDGTHIATASLDTTVRVWDLHPRDFPDVFAGHEDSLRDVIWSPDDTRLVTASEDGTARVWDVQTGESVITLFGHEAPVTQAAWNADESLILTASEDGTARVWDGRTGHELAVQSRYPDSPVWSPDGARVASTRRGSYGWVAVWKAEDPNILTDWRGHLDKVWHVAWSPDGARIVTAGNDRAARVWDATTGREVFSAPHKLEVHYAAWNLEGDRIATACEDRTAQVWDVEKRSQLHVLSDHSAEVRYVSWNRAGTRIVTVAQDGTARVWDANSGRPISVLIGHVAPITRVAWSHDGSDIATASEDGTARIHHFLLEDLKEAACVRALRNMALKEWQSYFDEPYRKTCPNLPAHPSFIEEIISQAKAHYDQGDLEAALADYTRASQLAIETTDAKSNNNICWWGSINGFAEIILPACERAVELVPSYGRYRDSRGLARALTGDYAGAVEDFKFYVEWSKENSLYQRYRGERETWIAELEAGRNPFDLATLQALRNE